MALKSTDRRVDELELNKQNNLVSGVTIKTINENSVLGSGNLTIGVSATWGGITGTLSTQTDLQSALDAKQDDLISGTNIKTVNGNSLLGSGDISIPSTILYNSTSPVLVTGTTNETLIASIPIPTSITNTILRASFVVVVTTLGAAAPRTRMRIGTIATPTSIQLPVQTQLGTNAVGSANAVSMYRTMPVVGGVFSETK